MGEKQGRAIHETAIVSPGAEISGGVRIGPYSVIGDRVTIMVVLAGGINDQVRFEIIKNRLNQIIYDIEKTLIGGIGR